MREKDKERVGPRGFKAHQFRFYVENRLQPPSILLPPSRLQLSASLSPSLSLVSYRKLDSSWTSHWIQCWQFLPHSVSNVSSTSPSYTALKWICGYRHSVLNKHRLFPHLPFSKYTQTSQTNLNLNAADPRLNQILIYFSLIVYLVCYLIWYSMF